jgi:hypothetical protein
VSDPIVGLLLNEVGYPVLASQPAGQVFEGITSVNLGLMQMGLSEPGLDGIRTIQEDIRAFSKARLRAAEDESAELSRKLRAVSEKRDLLTRQLRTVTQDTQDLEAKRKTLEQQRRNYDGELKALELTNRPRPRGRGTYPSATVTSGMVPPYPSSSRPAAVAASTTGTASLVPTISPVAEAIVASTRMAAMEKKVDLLLKAMAPTGPPRDASTSSSTSGPGAKADNARKAFKRRSDGSAGRSKSGVRAPALPPKAAKTDRRDGSSGSRKERRDDSSAARRSPAPSGDRGTSHRGEARKGKGRGKSSTK